VVVRVAAQVAAIMPSAQEHQGKATTAAQAGMGQLTLRAVVAVAQVLLGHLIQAHFRAQVA
jgi:hypothetical protein